VSELHTVDYREGDCSTVGVVGATVFNSVSDPDSIRSMDMDSGSGSWRAKMTHKNRKKLRKFMF
jgi:hypothetical protein